MLFQRLVPRARIVAFLSCILVQDAASGDVHHYVFFNRDRERISETAFLETKAFEGAQLKYLWRELEYGMDAYDFGEIRRDLSFLEQHGKKLFIQIQDVSFDLKVIPVPGYLLKDPRFNGGAEKQFDIKDDDEEHAVPIGWAARRWDPAVQERFHKLLLALGREFDGRIQGINLAETAIEFGESGKLYPAGFTAEIYRDAIVTNLTVLKRAFPRSVTIAYANFMPGPPATLQRVYRTANELKVGVGGPDLLPYKPWQMRNSYPLIRERAPGVTGGIAVQDGNYELVNPQTGRQVTINELVGFATEYLRIDYVFWCTQEPYYSGKVVPFLQAQRR